MALPEGGVRGVWHASLSSNKKPVLGRAFCLRKGRQRRLGVGDITAEREGNTYGQGSAARGMPMESEAVSVWGIVWGMKKGPTDLRP